MIGITPSLRFVIMYIFLELSRQLWLLHHLPTSVDHHMRMGVCFPGLRYQPPKLVSCHHYVWARFSARGNKPVSVLSTNNRSDGLTVKCPLLWRYTHSPCVGQQSHYGNSSLRNSIRLNSHNRYLVLRARFIIATISNSAGSYTACTPTRHDIFCCTLPHELH